MRILGYISITAYSILPAYSPSVRVGICSPSPFRETCIAPKGWVGNGSTLPDNTVHLQKDMRWRNRSELLSHLYEVSDSFDTRYDQHLFDEDVLDVLEPSDVNWRDVYDWLEDDGVLGFSTTDLGRIRDRIKPSLPTLSTIESIIDTERNVYRHDDLVELVWALVFANIMKECWLCLMILAVVDIYQSWGL